MQGTPGLLTQLDAPMASNRSTRIKNIMFVILRSVVQLLQIESILNHLKARFDAAPANNSWDYIGRMSPAIPTLRDVQDHVEYNINPFARYKKHSSPDANKDIETLSTYYTINRVHVAQPNRCPSANNKAHDVLRCGSEKLLLRSFIGRWYTRRTRERSSQEDWDALLNPEK